MPVKKCQMGTGVSGLQGRETLKKLTRQIATLFAVCMVRLLPLPSAQFWACSCMYMHTHLRQLPCQPWNTITWHCNLHAVTGQRAHSMLLHCCTSSNIGSSRT